MTMYFKQSWALHSPKIIRALSSTGANLITSNFAKPTAMGYFVRWTIVNCAYFHRRMIFLEKLKPVAFGREFALFSRHQISHLFANILPVPRLCCLGLLTIMVGA